MLRASFILSTVLILATTALGVGVATVCFPAAAPTVRFDAVDIMLNIPAGAELGSYQIELAPLADQHTTVRVVGIEGGEHQSFQTPPFYDPKAIGNERVILAAYSTADELPSGTTRIARVHYEISGEGELPDLVQLLSIHETVTTDRAGIALDTQPTLTPSKGARQ